MHLYITSKLSKSPLFHNPELKLPAALCSAVKNTQLNYFIFYIKLNRGFLVKAYVIAILCVCVSLFTPESCFDQLVQA